MAKCRVCGRKAVITIPYARASFCPNHFIEYYERRVLNTVKRYGLISEGDRVLVALSGGKDSVALLSVLASLRDHIRFDLVAIHINLGIAGFSEVAEEVSKEVGRKLNVKLVTISLREAVGASVPELARRSRRSVCAVCGLIKRFILNATALTLQANSLATGHNMDDLMANIVKEFLNMNLDGIGKLIPKTPSVGSIAVGRIRPLYEVTERENLVYVIVKGLPFVKVSCPYVNREGIEYFLKAVLTELDVKYPGLRVSFMRNLARRFSRSVSTGTEELGRCSICGMISSGEVCSFCKLTEKALGTAMGARVKSYIESLVREELA